MSNREKKPKRSSQKIIEHMKEKGIKFELISEEEAIDYLTNKNNYLRTASYRKNYEKFQRGENEGQYINLDFAYLVELSTIDMHFRYLILKMCLDIEHDLKIQLLKDIESNLVDNGYDIVCNFLTENPYVISKIEQTSNAPFTYDLIRKYFSIEKINENGKFKNKITSYSDCPAWILIELLTFGDFIKFYNFYYKDKSTALISPSVLNLIRNLRNGVAHNNCILNNLSAGSSYPPKEVRVAVEQCKVFTKTQKTKKLSCRPMLEFVSLLYSYKLIVSDKIKEHRTIELKYLFENRMLRHKDYFYTNDIICSNYDFIYKIITAFFS